MSIPVIIGVGFKALLSYAKNKEHQFSHQVEEVELEGVAAAQLEEGLGTKEVLEKFVNRLERTTAQFGKMGGRFSPADHSREMERLERLKSRVVEDPEAGPECKTLLARANQCLMQYAPQ